MFQGHTGLWGLKNCCPNRSCPLGGRVAQLLSKGQALAHRQRGKAAAGMLTQSTRSLTLSATSLGKVFVAGEQVQAWGVPHRLRGRQGVGRVSRGRVGCRASVSLTFFIANMKPPVQSRKPRVKEALAFKPETRDLEVCGFSPMASTVSQVSSLHSSCRRH